MTRCLLTVLAFGGLCVLIAPFATAQVESELPFSDSFDRELAPGWEWRNENPARWCVRDGALEIGMSPPSGGNAENQLRRALPSRAEGTLTIETTLTSLSDPTNQYEQTGLYLTQGDRLIFKFVKERIDGVVYVFPGKIPMDESTVRIRLILSEDQVEAQYQPGGEGEFLTATTTGLPAPTDDETIGVQCWHGPTDADHWIRFDDFVIRCLDE